MTFLDTVNGKIFQRIIDYLDYSEKIAFIFTHSSFYSSWFKKIRIIRIYQEEEILQFFEDDSFRQSLLEKVVYPNKQIIIEDRYHDMRRMEFSLPSNGSRKKKKKQQQQQTNGKEGASNGNTPTRNTNRNRNSSGGHSNNHLTIINKEERFPSKIFPFQRVSKNFTFPCFHGMNINTELFEYLNILANENSQKEVVGEGEGEGEEGDGGSGGGGKGIESIEYLGLRPAFNYDYENVFPYIAKATKELILFEWNINSALPLSPNLEHLALIWCKRNDLSLSLLNGENLKKLSLQDTYITNLPDFTYLQEVVLTNIEELTDSDLPPLNAIKKLAISNCSNITTIDCLQDNEEIKIRFCEKIIDYSHSFQNSQKIDIQLVGGFQENDIQINLSNYTKVTSFFFEKRHGPEVEGNWMSEEGIPSSLKKVKIHSVPGFNSVEWFSSVYMIELMMCDGIESLIGLGNVPKVLLTRLELLLSLNGLGAPGNKYVRVEGCHWIQDFSPLKSIRSVEIADCGKFYNGHDVEHVGSLVLIDCDAINDVSMLHSVHHLILVRCNRVRSIVGLENIPKLETYDCENLQLTRPTESIADKDLGIRIISDRLTYLPDNLYPIILEYLLYEEKIKWITCNTYFYQRLYKRYREIDLIDEEIVDFYTNPAYREEILSKIEDPYNQLRLMDQSKRLTRQRFFIFDGSAINLTGIRTLDTSANLFCSLLDLAPQSIPKLRHLALSHYSVFLSAPFDPAFHQFLTKATETLLLKNLHLPDDACNPLPLASTLNEVLVNDCSSNYRLPPLPNLRYLTLINTQLLNPYTDFTNLFEINLHGITITDVTPFQKIRRVVFGNCSGITNIEVLQTNDEIHIAECEGLVNFTETFREIKKITLVMDTQMEFQINFSYYQKAKHITIRGEDGTTIKKPFAWSAIPASLEVLEMDGIFNLDQLGPAGSYDHLRLCLIMSCPKFTSVVGLGAIHTIKLFDLNGLKSLKGLGQGNQYVSIASCMKIKSFSVLKKVPKVDIIDCDNFTKASDLEEVKTLRIVRCSKLRNVKALQHIDHLELIGCSKEISTAELSRVRELIVRDYENHDFVYD